MKKFMALFLVSGILSGFLFAQDDVQEKALPISISGWGQAAFNPLLYQKIRDQDGKAFAGIGSAWDNMLDLELYISGGIERIGFEFDISYFSGSNVNIGSNAYIWAKPFNWLKINVGRFDDNYLRGKLGDPNFSYAVMPDGVGDKNVTFNRFRVRSGAGLVLTPVDGLYAAAAVKGNIDALVRPGKEPSEGGETPTEADDVYEGIQAAIGYTISNIGLIRTQYLGGPDNKTIETAFAFTGKEGLILDLGAKIPIDNDNAYNISLRGKINAGNFSTLAYIDTGFGGDTINSSIAGLYLEPSYDFGKIILGLDFDVRIGDHTEKDDITLTNLGFGVWALKNFLENGSVQIGLAFIAPVDGNDKTMSLGIPILLEYSF
jgi:hypothetical protein